MIRAFRLPRRLPVALLIGLVACGRPAATTGAGTPGAAPAPAIVAPTIVDAAPATAAPTITDGAPATAAPPIANGTPSPALPPSGSPSVDQSASPLQSIPPAAQQLVQLAVADAARRWGVASGAIETVAVTAMTWPNSQLGCGGADMGAETPTPGFRILLRAANRQLDYHTDMQRVLWCDKARS